MLHVYYQSLLVSYASLSLPLPPPLSFSLPPPLSISLLSPPLFLSLSPPAPLSPLPISLRSISLLCPSLSFSLFSLLSPPLLSLQWREIHEFVDQVNSGVQAQEETERVKDAMSRITAYQVGEIPSELEDVSRVYGVRIIIIIQHYNTCIITCMPHLHIEQFH